MPGDPLSRARAVQIGRPVLHHAKKLDEDFCQRFFPSRVHGSGLGQFEFDCTCFNMDRPETPKRIIQISAFVTPRENNRSRTKGNSSRRKRQGKGSTKSKHKTPNAFASPKRTSRRNRSLSPHRRIRLLREQFGKQAVDVNVYGMEQGQHTYLGYGKSDFFSYHLCPVRVNLISKYMANEVHRKRRSPFLNRRRLESGFPEWRVATSELKYSDCGICNESIFQGDVVAELVECGHIYHTKCLKPYFIQTNYKVCPLCNYHLCAAELKSIQRKNQAGKTKWFLQKNSDGYYQSLREDVLTPVKERLKKKDRARFLELYGHNEPGYRQQYSSQVIHSPLKPDEFIHAIDKSVHDDVADEFVI